MTDLSAEQAAFLAEQCVTIDPFKRLGYRESGLYAYFTRPDPSLTRSPLFDQGRLAGLICLRQPWLRGALIETLVVLPEAQRRGVARVAITLARQQTGANLWATVSAFNRAARDFYAAHGFIEQCPLPDLVRSGEAEILLRWQKL